MLHFGVCFYCGPSTCFAPLIPFLCVKKLNDLKKVTPIKLETQLYLLILSLSTWGYFYAHCCPRLLIFSCIYLIYILSFGIVSLIYDQCVQSRLWIKKKWESKYYCFKRVMKRQKMMLYDKSLPDKISCCRIYFIIIVKREITQFYIIVKIWILSYSTLQRCSKIRSEIQICRVPYFNICLRN